ncbi:MAG: hypothetical protein HC774_06260 [Sphingomonadales bacterium]|nr:hypothetical protein [Sphingomonadales bacterium]
MPPVRAKARECDLSARVHDALRRRLGVPIYDHWLKDAALIYDDPRLTVIVASEFQRSWIEDRYGQLIGHVAREAALLFPGLPDGPAHAMLRATTARHPFDDELGAATQQGFEMVLPEVLLDFPHAAQGTRRLLASAPRLHRANTLLPLFDDGGIAHDLDIPLESLERHAAKTFLVQATQRGLVGVVVGRPQQHTAGDVPGDIAEIPFTSSFSSTTSS